MELYFAASGVKHELDVFETQMQCIPFGLPFKTKEGDEMIQPIYGMLSPIKLYRYVFPKEYLDEVIKTLGLETAHKYYSSYNLQATALRKILRAKKLPKPKEEAKPRLINKFNVGIIGIGYKEDKEITDKQGNTLEGI